MLNEQQLDTLGKQLLEPLYQGEISEIVTDAICAIEVEFNEALQKLHPQEQKYIRGIEKRYIKILGHQKEENKRKENEQKGNNNNNNNTPQEEPVEENTNDLDGHLMIACARIALLKLQLARANFRAFLFTSTSNFVFYGVILGMFDRLYRDECFDFETFVRLINASIKVKIYTSQMLAPLELFILKDVGLIRSPTVNESMLLAYLTGLEQGHINSSLEEQLPKPLPIPQHILQDNKKEDSVEYDFSVLKLKYLFAGTLFKEYQTSNTQSLIILSRAASPANRPLTPVDETCSVKSQNTYD